MEFETLWGIIKDYEGVLIVTKWDVEFEYKIDSDEDLQIEEKNYTIRKSELKECFDSGAKGPSGIKKASFDFKSSYIWAIVNNAIEVSGHSGL